MKKIITYQLLLVLLGLSCSKRESQKSKSQPNIGTEGTVVENLLKNTPFISDPDKNQVMVLGSFHFDRGRDGSDVISKNHIDITSQENQQEIEEIVDAIITKFNPTIIAVEWMPDNQTTIDSAFSKYKKGKWELKKHESFQIGFRIAKKLNLSTIYCIDNRPPQPETVTSIDDWDEYAQQLGQVNLWHEYDEHNNAYNNYLDSIKSKLSIKQYLKLLNTPEINSRNKQFWVTGLVNLGYKDKYVGADLTGHWYRRNTRIFVNARNLCASENEKVLIIYGQSHKWILDELFESSPEFEVIQPGNDILN